MHAADREHMIFITDKGLYCHNVMSFSLNNTGATYQHSVKTIFAKLIGTSIKVYVDDMLVKSRIANQYLQNLSLMFGVLKKHNKHLSQNKCALSITSIKFLNFMIS